MLFCIIEELSYTVIESTASFLSHCGVRLPSGQQSSGKSNSNVEMVEAVITAVSDEPANLVTLSITKSANITPYKWNEAVVLVSSVNLLSSAARNSSPSLLFGIINTADSTASKEGWQLNVNLSKEQQSVLAVQSKLYLYSISTFTSYLRYSMGDAFIIESSWVSATPAINGSHGNRY